MGSPAGQANMARHPFGGVTTGSFFSLVRGGALNNIEASVCLFSRVLSLFLSSSCSLLSVSCTLSLACRLFATCFKPGRPDGQEEEGRHIKKRKIGTGRRLLRSQWMRMRIHCLEFSGMVSEPDVLILADISLQARRRSSRCN